MAAKASRSVHNDKMQLCRLLVRRFVPAHRGLDIDLAEAHKVVREFLETPRRISSVEREELVQKWVGKESH